ncbi:hypothetical protein AQUSIP_15210 [Aquicella siphonis]|uniref:Adhesin n=1 Tax=Aquicella siphonis TaxID=254247 RepID=A0A5E4PHZ7_9COXI|nr:hypothetical protein [Aquicella siphonis]VVC76215.1 hypothetical protein AQUSIP_15210 [Aquicella siphonis]
MKRKISLAAVLGVSILAISPFSVYADPAGIRVTVQCPGTNNGANVITNFGDYAAGYGMETIENQGQFPVYFKSAVLSPNTPANLSSYYNRSVQYDSTSGRVSCNYSSSNLTEPDLTVAYVLTNGKGGAVLASDSIGVTFSLPVGRSG